MKKLFLVLLLISGSFYTNAQLATVTGGNFGASLSGGYLLNKPTGNGFGFSAGVTTSFFEIFFPEISYEFNSYSLGVDTSNNEINGSSNYLGFGINNKVPVLSLRMGKSKHQECWYLNIKLLLDYKFRLGLGTSILNPKNQNGVNFGLGFRPSYSGSDKSRVAWAFFYDFYYHLDLNKSSSSSISGIKNDGLFFRLTVLHYKTSDMLGGGSKKKAYNRKY